MPVYLVTDTLAGHKVMVEAERPAGAITALIANRFDVSQGLAAGDALRLMGEGIPFINAGAESAAVVEEDQDPPSADLESTGLTEVDEETARMLDSGELSPLDDDAPEFAEVDEDPTERRPSLSEILGGEAEDNDASDLAFLR